MPQQTNLSIGWTGFWTLGNIEVGVEDIIQMNEGGVEIKSPPLPLHEKLGTDITV